MKRLYDNLIADHFNEDDMMLFLTGPRQVGKTTTSMSVADLGSPLSYFNWDNDEHRMIIISGTAAVAKVAKLEQLSAKKTFVIFDEIHKFKEWKQFLKGFYDVYQDRAEIIVTGSAKLDPFKKGGDSMMGRYFSYRVHPLSVAELIRQDFADNEISPPKELSKELLDQLYSFGGFPKPFIKANKAFHNKWQRMKRQQLFREDIRDLTKIEDIAKLEILGDLLIHQGSERLNHDKLAKKFKYPMKQWHVGFNP